MRASRSRSVPSAVRKGRTSGRRTRRSSISRTRAPSPTLSRSSVTGALSHRKISRAAGERCTSLVRPVPHPDVESERAYLTFAAKCLAEMRARTEAYVNQEDLAAGEFDTAAVRWHLTQRLRSLEDESAVLCFGRIDLEQVSSKARRSGDAGACATGELSAAGGSTSAAEVDDPDGEPVIVDWRADVAIAFYRATAADPFGLRVRRRFTFADRELADIFEEDFTDPDSVLAAAAGEFPTRCSPSCAGRGPARCATSSPRSRPSRTS